MNKDLEKFFTTAEDILNTAGIVYDICKEDDGETTVKIRPLVELIYKKADRICIQIINGEENQG